MWGLEWYVPYKMQSALAFLNFPDSATKDCIRTQLAFRHTVSARLISFLLSWNLNRCTNDCKSPSSRRAFETAVAEACSLPALWHPNTLLLLSSSDDEQPSSPAHSLDMASTRQPRWHSLRYSMDSWAISWVSIRSWGRL